uniref:PASTA domain-containing protein n=1 Tax=Steinernema glaseri TaxID=37863 RepID=A0A1I7XX44_9BILA
GGEGADVHAAFAQALYIGGGQGVTANAVEQHVDLHPFRGLSQQQRLEFTADAVVVDDEELDQYRVVSRFYRLEDRVEGGLPVDQQADLVVGQARHTPKLGHGPQRRIGFGVARGQRLFHPGAPVEVDGKPLPDMEFMLGQLKNLPPEQRAMIEGGLAKQGISVGGKGVRSCLTQEQVQTNDIPLQDPQSGCTQKITERNGNVWKFTFSCPKAQGN